jgi:WXG100 family type VII secretion target
MSDIENLQHLSGQLRQGAQQFSTAAHTLRQQAQRLDWSAQDLASGVNAWAGQGSQNFTTSWNNYHQNTQQAASALDTTSQSLTKLAQKIDEAVEQLKEQQSHQTALAIGLGVLTVALVVVDVLQLGLDPVTDAATVAVGSAEVAAVEGAEVAAGAAEGIAGGLVEADATIASELEAIDVGETTEAGDILLEEGGLPEDIAFDEEPLIEEPLGEEPLGEEPLGEEPLGEGEPPNSSATNPGFTKGEVDWVPENAHMSPQARAYNDAAPGARVNPETGVPEAPELSYQDASGNIKPVRFDGHEGDVMIDRKLSVTTFPKSQAQALRQSEALSQNGLTGRWEVPTQAEATRALKLFDKLGITNIDVKVVPFP